MLELGGSSKRTLRNLAVYLIAVVLLICGLSDPVSGAKPLCGNDICEGNEPRTCPGDCAVTPPPQPGVESCGCENGLPTSKAKAGRTYLRELTIGSNPTTQYEVRLPSNYDPSKDGGFPVLIYLHGWGGSFRSLPADFARHAKNNGYLVVTPSGYGDGERNSWNGFRSSRLPDCPRSPDYLSTDCDAGPPTGPSTCIDLDGSGFDYCYDSCRDENGECPRWDGVSADNTWGAEFNGDYTCYWTTCLDSVAQIEAILDEVESLYCVDRSMIWVTGCSNGGMFVFELAKDPRTSNRFAGYLPQVGSPHPGFVQRYPELEWTPKNLLGFWGTNDTTVPGRANAEELLGSDVVALDTNFNGWLYMTARAITEEWALLNGVATAPSPYDASDYSSSLECSAWQNPGEDGAEIVECFFEGGHSCPGFGAMPRMMMDFARRHALDTVPPSSCAP